MPTLTITAAARLKRLFEQSGLSTRESLRLRAVAGGIELGFDEPRPDDAALVHGNRTLLVLDPATSRRLSGRVIDVESTAAGDDFVIV